MSLADVLKKELLRYIATKRGLFDPLGHIRKLSMAMLAIAENYHHNLHADVFHLVLPDHERY